MSFTWISPHQPAVVLAPMEGVTDAPMRALMTEIGGLSFCVSEFLRVTHQLYPNHVFQEHVPEFETSCKTPAGVPVQIQLLGGDEEMMALNAQRACNLGAKAIDINFGCPSPVVNRHDGGASLLRYPERIRRIVAAVRQAVPVGIPVSAKLRLGWESMDDIFINAENAALGGASWITIHGRTKMQGYTPPAYWQNIGKVREMLDIPVVANGDIWTREDFLRCRDQTGCKHFMIGRGALANPVLARQIARELGLDLSSQAPADFTHHPAEWEPLLKRFSEIATPEAVAESSKQTRYVVCRIKQWLKMAGMRTPLGPWFDEVKRCNTVEDVFAKLSNSV